MANEEDKNNPLFQPGYELLSKMPELSEEDRQWAADFGTALISYFSTNGKYFGSSYVKRETIVAAYAFALAIMENADRTAKKRPQGDRFEGA